MKSKKEKIALIIAIIWIVIVIGAIVAGIFLFGKIVKITKNSITSEKFISIMEDNDFRVVDVTKQFENADIDVKEGYVAAKDDYQVEFYTFKNEDDAETFYKINMAKFDTDSAKTRIQLSGQNYSSFNVEANGKYKFLERINKTVIYLNVDDEYKGDVKDTLKELGY